MGGDVAQGRTLKKADLAAYAAEQAAERRFAPKALSWSSNLAVIDDVGPAPDSAATEAAAEPSVTEPTHDTATALRPIQGGAQPIEAPDESTPFDRETPAQAHQWTREVNDFDLCSQGDLEGTAQAVDSAAA